MGNGTTTAHKQMAAEVLTTTASRVAIINADTDRTPYDTGTFASTGTVVAGRAVVLTAEALRHRIIEFAARGSGVAEKDCRLEHDAVVVGSKRRPLTEIHAESKRAGYPLEAMRKGYLSPRTIAFNAHGVRLAINRMTGETILLFSVHAADIGRLINPMQCHGQIDGALAQGYGWALYENMAYDEKGVMQNPQFRNYRIPSYAPTSRGAEIYFADTYDRIGPLGAKAQGESAINPVAPAVANAIANATGVRFPHLPFTPDKIYDVLHA